MKKLILLSFLIIFITPLVVKAQYTSRGALGISTGFISSSKEIKNVNTTSINRYSLGLSYRYFLTENIALQAFLLYNVKGARLDLAKNLSLKDLSDSFEENSSYLELPLQLQIGPNLALIRPYVLVEAYLSYQLGNSWHFNGDRYLNVRSNIPEVLNNKNKDYYYGFSVGAGLDFMKLQLAFRYFMTMGPVSGAKSKSYEDILLNAVSKFNHKRYHGINFTLTLFFS